MKQQVLQATRELYEAEAVQVRKRTIPDIELTRTEALLSSAELEVIQATREVSTLRMGIGVYAIDSPVFQTSLPPTK